jgi:hypothetical protein
MNDFELLRDLRAMRRPAEPAADLWPPIAARIAPAAGAGPAPRRPMWPEALAATLVLGLGALLAFGTREAPTMPAPAAAVADGRLPWSVREALTLDAAYAGALDEARRAAPAPRGEVLRADRELEAAQRALEDALAQQPEAVHLLGLLRRTHEQRLRLAQRQASMG